MIALTALMNITAKFQWKLLPQADVLPPNSCVMTELVSIYCYTATASMTVEMDLMNITATPQHQLSQLPAHQSSGSVRMDLVLTHDIDVIGNITALMELMSTTALHLHYLQPCPAPLNSGHAEMECALIFIIDVIANMTALMEPMSLIATPRSRRSRQADARQLSFSVAPGDV
jgi:hypothetical protein